MLLEWNLLIYEVWKNNCQGGFTSKLKFGPNFFALREIWFISGDFIKTVYYALSWNCATRMQLSKHEKRQFRILFPTAKKSSLRIWDTLEQNELCCCLAHLFLNQSNWIPILWRSIPFWFINSLGTTLRISQNKSFLEINNALFTISDDDWRRGFFAFPLLLFLLGLLVFTTLLRGTD